MRRLLSLLFLLLTAAVMPAPSCASAHAPVQHHAMATQSHHQTIPASGDHDHGLCEQGLCCGLAEAPDTPSVTPPLPLRRLAIPARGDAQLSDITPLLDPPPPRRG